MKFYARKMLLNSPKAYVHVRLDCIHIRLIRLRLFAFMRYERDW